MITEEPFQDIIQKPALRKTSGEICLHLTYNSNVPQLISTFLPILGEKANARVKTTQSDRHSKIHFNRNPAQR